jgi:arabinan endo-1,5-alpha-L-arabinosidase
MTKKKFIKTTSCFIAGVVSSTFIVPNTTFVFADTTTRQTTSDSTTQTQTPISAKERASVHDPSVVKDEKTGEYYVFGSHIEAAKSSDLENWDKFTNSYTTPDNTIFGDLATNLAGSFAWAGENDSDCKGGYAVWAPSVMYNSAYKNSDGTYGAYMMYYCTSSTYKRSAIGYAVSQNIEGPYTYVDTIMYSGFTNTGKATYDSNSTINTEVSTLTSDSRIPTDVNSKWFNSDGSYNTDYAPNAIDPELFWDQDGKLWMDYGSWSGGIFMLQIDPATGKPIYPGTDANTSALNNTDRYFGKRVAGGHTDSGEGSKIVYDKATGYYYLYMSYAGLAAQGGYNIRLFRSTSPTGPFVDAKGQNAALPSAVDNTAYGIKLIGNYKLNCLSVGYRSAGGNTSFIDDDGQMYLVYHQRFDDGTENHQVRVHQMFINQDGWPVVAPYENNDDKISATGYSSDDIVGDYQFINHGTSSSASMLTTQNIRLNSDGSITGDITGTWSKTDGTYYMNAVIDGVTYKGVFFKQQDESSYVNKVMTFSAVGSNNQVIWGSKLELSDSDALSYVENIISNDIPSTTKAALTLPTSAAYDTTIKWSSSDEDVISNDGKVNRPIGSDKTVTLIATISTKSGQSITKEFSVLVKGILNFTETPLYEYNFDSSNGTSIVNSGSVGTTTSASATLIGNSSIVDDSTMGKVLQVKSKTGEIDTNYLALPTNSFSTISKNGFSVGMWVNVDTTDSNYWQHSALFEADSTKAYPMTRIGANLIARINAGNGSYSDTDIASLKSNTWQYLTYTVGTTGIVVYLNGVEVGRQDKDITASLANNILASINNVRVGSGSIWNDKDLASAKFDNVALYDSALTDQEVEGLYTRELSSLSETSAINSVTASDEGDYRCIVSDETGNTTSSAVKLTLSSNHESASKSSSSLSSSTSTDTGTITVDANEASVQNAIKNSAEKTIIINLPTVTQPNSTNNVPILTQNIILGLKANLDKTLVLKTNDSTIEIKGKDGQIQFTQNNTPLSGFTTIGQSKYYLNSNGIMQTGWVQTPDSNWYYLDKATGVMKSEWIQDTNGIWYYLNKTSGAMSTGWVQDTYGAWYYLDRTSGAMKTGWIQDNGQWYFLYSNGSLATSTTIDGYAVDESGKWIG